MEKEEKLVITFPTTTAALAMDDAAPSRLGRLIPIPGEISAGCGFAWQSEVELEKEVLTVLKEHDIEFEEKHILML